MKQDAAHYVEEQKKIIWDLTKQNEDLLEACKNGIKFLDSCPDTETNWQAHFENRVACRKILNAAITEAEKED